MRHVIKTEVPHIIFAKKTLQKTIDKYTWQTLWGVLMNKEEILTKSRKENKNQDIYEQEVLIKGNRVGCVVAAVLAGLFGVIQIFVGGGMNYGLYAIVVSIPMASFWTKYVKLRKKHELYVAVLDMFVVVSCSIAHIYNLISTSTIL